MRTRRAFSLIELLVVVAIVSLLLAVLLPALGRARQQGKRTVCLSNMRQIGVAVRMYLPDHGDWFPRTMETVSTGSPQTVSWWAIDNYQRALEPYIAQDIGGVNAAGRTATRRNVWFDPGDPDAAIPAMWGSFSDNGLITGVPRRESQLRRPAETVYATLRHANWSETVGVPIPSPLPIDDADHPFWRSEFFDMCLDPWADTTDVDDQYHWSRGRAAPPRSLFPAEPGAAEWDQQIDGRGSGTEPRKPRYGDGQPYLFCDGHAAFMPFEQTYAGVQNNMWDTE